LEGWKIPTYIHTCTFGNFEILICKTEEEREKLKYVTVRKPFTKIKSVGR
jgi:hypothetical protein